MKKNFGKSSLTLLGASLLSVSALANTNTGTTSTDMSGAPDTHMNGTITDTTKGSAGMPNEAGTIGVEPGDAGSAITPRTETERKSMRRHRTKSPVNPALPQRQLPPEQQPGTSGSAMPAPGSGTSQSGASY